jgi:N-acetylglucosaminyldiphosphoundecaprenol N-acetyl-beta-D-mannosaminyltransferase
VETPQQLAIPGLATPSIRVLGVRIDDITMQETCDRVAQMIESGGAYQVATVNPEFIMRARRDVEFARVLEHTTLNVPDGVGVLWAARRQGHPLRERVGGADLMQRLCAQGSQYGWRVFFLGAREGVAERAAADLAFMYQGLIVAGARAGSPSPQDDAESVAAIQRANPSLLFVAYGAPGQDIWLSRNLPQLTELVAPASGLVGIGVGGSFDYITGEQKRAPLQMQRMGLEWLYRLIRQPCRIWRQLALVLFVFAVMLQSRYDGRHAESARGR